MMRLVVQTFSMLIKEWNKRPLSEKDFLRICKKLGVEVIEEDSNDMEWKGLFTVILDTPTIIINARLKGMERLWSMFHELGHHILHSPATCFFSHDTHRKTQAEANFFAAVALIPEGMVRQIPLWEVYEVDEYSAKLLQMRLEFFELYKI